MIYIKKNISQNSEVLAVCDEDLIGKTFKEKGLKLDVTERFYKGKLFKEEDAVELIRNAKSINVVGKNSIKLMVKEKLIRREEVIKIKNIPHAIILEL